MAKNQHAWNIITIVVVAVVGLVTSQSDRLFGKGESAGLLKAEVHTICTEVKRIDMEGCKPSVIVRRNVVGIMGDVERNKEDIKKIDEKLDKIIDILTAH